MGTRHRRQRLGAAVLLTVCLVAVWACAYEDMSGDIYPKVRVYEGKFHVYFWCCNTRQKMCDGGHFKNIYTVDGKVVQDRLEYAEGDLVLASERRSKARNEAATKEAIGYSGYKRLPFGGKTYYIPTPAPFQAPPSHYWVVDGKKRREVALDWSGLGVRKQTSGGDDFLGLSRFSGEEETMLRDVAVSAGYACYLAVRERRVPGRHFTWAQEVVLVLFDLEGKRKRQVVVLGQAYRRMYGITSGLVAYRGQFFVSYLEYPPKGGEYRLVLASYCPLTNEERIVKVHARDSYGDMQISMNRIGNHMLVAWSGWLPDGEPEPYIRPRNPYTMGLDSWIQSRVMKLPDPGVPMQPGKRATNPKPAPNGPDDMD